MPDAGSTNEREMLEEQLDFLLDSLRDLERERAAGDIDEPDYEALRNDYIARAADISHRLSGDEVDRDDETPPLPRRPWTKRIVSVLVVVSLAGASGAWVAASAGQRLPGRSSSGGIIESTSTMLSTARQLNFSDPTKAIELYNDVLKLEPDNVEALTYRAWLIALTAREATGNLRDVAYATVLADLLKAREVDPTYPDAACFLGITYFRFMNNAKLAKVQLDECQANNPPQEVTMFLNSIVDQVNAAVGGK
jgi:tetratricopeptide (TPR) repeat protein